LSAPRSPSREVAARSATGVDRARERRLRWIVRLGVPLVRLLGATWRIRLVNNGGSVDALRRERQPIVFALWHGDMLPLLYQHRDEGVSVLISEHHDGELIARVAESLGFRTVRGSTSRGASRALVGLARELEAGHDVAITPDGPRGPARSFAPGALIAAQRADAPVLAVGVSAKRAWRLRTWDRFLIPKPFSKVSVAYAPPVQLEAATARAASEETSRFQALMLETERLAADA
jgi:lysophospholipid acyltransferase (LPLAT)-like uncharacterized protein